ncbi:MAG: single-stranded DNA-binding protein [Rikenellaceae bacterium]
MVNKVILVGNAGADAEVHVFESGSKIARIRVATTERIYNPATQQWTDHIEWHQVVIPQRQANFAESYVKKGSQVYIEGRIRRREWGEEGAKHYSFEIRADEIRLLGRRPDTYDSSNSYHPQQQSSQPQQPQQQTYTTPQQPQATPNQQASYGQPVSETPQPQHEVASNSYESQATANDPTDDLPF